MLEVPLKSWNSTPLFARSWSKPNCKDVFLCLHGAESHSGWFADIAPLCVELDFAIFAFDRTGYGRSPGARGCPPSKNRMMNEILDALSWCEQRYQRVHLVGLSWGGLLAASLEQKYSKRFATLNLISPAFFPIVRMAPLEIFKAVVGGTGNLPLKIEDFASSKEIQARIQGDHLRVTVADLRFLLMTWGLLTQVERVLSQSRASPIRLMIAEQDSMIDVAKTLAWATQNKVDTHIFSKSSHALTLEDPQRLAAALTAPWPGAYRPGA